MHQQAVPRALRTDGLCLHPGSVIYQMWDEWDKNQLWEKHTPKAGSAVSCLCCVNTFAMILNKTAIITSKRTIQGTWIGTDSLTVCELGDICELP